MINITRLGDLLKEMRGKRSLRDIEKISGVSYSYLRRIEKGIDPRTGKEFIPTPDTLRKLAKAYGCDYVYLMDIAGYLSDLSVIEKETFAINNDFQSTLEDIYNNHLKTIISGNSFIPNVRDEIKKLEKKYENHLETYVNLNLTPKLLQILIAKANWDDEWIFNLFEELVIIERNYIIKDVRELSEILSLPNISFKYRLLSEDDRKRILDMLKVLFPDEKEN